MNEEVTTIYIYINEQRYFPTNGSGQILVLLFTLIFGK
jgi:hypothetical protein